MAVIKQSSYSTTESYYQDCFVPGKVQALTPTTTTITIVRPYPQLDDSGKSLPMVLGMTDDGPDFSGVLIESTVIASGLTTKYNGFAKCSDRQELKPFDQPAAGLYIRLKASYDKNKLDAEKRAIVEPALRETPNQHNPKMKDKAIANARDTLFMQCAVLNFRGQDLGEKFIPNAVLVCAGSLFGAMGACLAEAHASGIDVFDPASGTTLIIEGLPADPRAGRQTAIFTVRVGDPMELTAEHVSQYVKPWDAITNFLTYEEQMTRLINGFGRPIIEVAFPSEVAAMYGGQVHSGAQAGSQQASLSRSATARPAGAAAPRTLGAPAAGVPAGPRTLGKPAAAPAAAGPRTLGKPASASVAAPAANELEAEYEKMIAEQQASAAGTAG